MNNARVEALKEELKIIHFTNLLYWKAGVDVNRAARAEYFRRQDRVLELRTQFVMHRAFYLYAHFDTSDN
jgi:hypothetical protein